MRDCKWSWCESIERSFDETILVCNLDGFFFSLHCTHTHRSQEWNDDRFFGFISTAYHHGFCKEEKKGQRSERSIWSWLLFVYYFVLVWRKSAAGDNSVYLDNFRNRNNKVEAKKKKPTDRDCIRENIKEIIEDFLLSREMHNKVIQANRKSDVLSENLFFVVCLQ